MMDSDHNASTPMPIFERRADTALLVLRIAVALVFTAHGSVKLFVMGHDGVTGFFTQVGVPLPGIAAWGISLLEFGGGLALAAGAFARPLALLFVGDMLGAISLVVFRKGFVGGFELEFLLSMGALTIVRAGAGAHSVDAKLGARAVWPT